MALAARTASKINTEITQQVPDRALRYAGRAGESSRKARHVRVTGGTRESSRDPARMVLEAEHGIVVYPPEVAGVPWRAAFTENGRRRFRRAMTEAGLAAKLEKVKARLAAGALNMERPGADLVARPKTVTAPWTWHSLRHVFCTTALFTWKLDATDVSRMATAPAKPPNRPGASGRGVSVGDP